LKTDIIRKKGGHKWRLKFNPWLTGWWFGLSSGKRLPREASYYLIPSRSGLKKER
jgi:hypothetical protein